MDRVYWIDAENNQLELSDTSRFAIVARGGLGMAATRVYTDEAPGIPGGCYLGEVAEQRKLKLGLVAWVSSEAELAALRDELVRAFNPRKGPGTLRVVRADGAVRELECICASGLTFDTPHKYGPLAIADQIVLQAFVPFWRDGNAQSVSTNLGTGTAFVFPMTFPFSFGVGEAAGNIAIINPGHEAAPLHVEFVNQCTNPKVTNVSQGRHVQVNASLAAGERLRIKTGVWSAEVTRVTSGGETNVLGLLSDDSDLVGLAALPGANTFQVEASGTVDLSCTIQFYPLYRGI